MNLQWGDKGIEWTDATWNPVTGCLSTKEQCAVRDVCYARRTAKKLTGRFGYPADDPFRPTFHPERLEEPYKLKKPAKIFVCSMGELFGPWVPREWQHLVLKVARDNPHHTFQFLTKFPERTFIWDLWPANAWLGVTVESEEYISVKRADDLMESPALVTYVSAEPLLGDIAQGLRLHGINWLIIGAQTKPKKQPKREWMENLLALANCWGVPVFMKKELDYESKRREWPGRREKEG